VVIKLALAYCELVCNRKKRKFTLKPLNLKIRRFAVIKSVKMCAILAAIRQMSPLPFFVVFVFGPCSSCPHEY